MVRAAVKEKIALRRQQAHGHQYRSTTVGRQQKARGMRGRRGKRGKARGGRGNMHGGAESEARHIPCAGETCPGKGRVHRAGPEGAMNRKGGRGKAKRGREGKRGSVRREMWRWQPDDDNDVEATTHEAWVAVSARWAAVCCAGVHREIAPERSTAPVDKGVEGSIVFVCKWYSDGMKC